MQLPIPNFDLTISISVILALAAIISPILTAIINNIHQTKIKKMELRQQMYEHTVMHERCIFENYLKHAGRCIFYSDSSALKDYGECYFNALMCAPPDLKKDMINANQYMQEADWTNASKTIEELSAKIRNSLQVK